MSERCPSTAERKAAEASATLLTSADLAALERLEETVNKALAAARIDLMSAAYQVFMSNANEWKRSHVLRVRWRSLLEMLAINISSPSLRLELTEPNGSSPCEQSTS